MCIFCKIINKEIPSKIVKEDDNFLAILDISQTTKGHTLVIPKKHYENILEMPKDELEKMISFSQDVANTLIKNLNANGLNVLSNINEVAGQTVMHAHIHLIPRYSLNDNISITFKENAYDLDEILNQIKK